MLPGKKYRPEDLLWIAWTRKWLIVIPTVVVGIGAFLWARTLPDRYSSATTILVVPQRVPESYVRSTVTASIQERLQTMYQQIVSRTRLERIIEEFNLYEEERKTMIMEDVVELMRNRDIQLSSGARRGDSGYFSVGFQYSNPRTAMRVAERIANMFVQENLQDRAVLADSTNQFLQTQLEDARRRLIEHEKQLVDFREKNAGRLPTQVQSNLQMMQVTQTQIQANQDAEVRERDRLTVVENAIAEGVSTIDQPLGNAPAAATSGAGESADPPAGTAAQQLEAARAGLRGLERRLRPSHPDIARAKRLIGELEARAAEEASMQGPVVDRSEAGAARSAVPDRITTLRMEAEGLRKSIDKRKAEDARLKASLSAYTARLESAPKLESDLTELMRDYDTLQGQYRALLQKSEESKIAANLERRQIGEQFKIIDNARLPERPISPDRPRIYMIGLLAGLGLGVAFGALLEYRDSTMKTDDDVVSSLALPVLAVIPAMITATDRSRTKRKRIIVGLAVSAASMAAIAVLAWRYQLLDRLVR